MSHDLKQPHFIFAPDIELKLMKIIYSPEFEGHVFLGMDKEHGKYAGTPSWHSP